jgi:glucose/arabinose dehydrogenase
MRRVWRLARFAVVVLAIGFIGGFLAIAIPSMTTIADSASPFVANTLDLEFNVSLEQVGSGFEQPLYLTHAGDGSGRVFVVEKRGRVSLLEDGERVTPAFLDIVSKVQSNGYEQGLLGLAFHPNYEENGFFFIYYTDRQTNNQVVSRFTVSADDPNAADVNSEKEILRMEDPFGNHNGGHMLFGADGYLYIGTGDGGAAGDPLGAGQSTENLLGKILRIDVDNGDPYGIPADNPFVNGGGAPEVWHFGLRNPWRFSFDRQTQDMYIGDVGQNKYEEISLAPAGSKGLNFGWNRMESFHCFPFGNGCDQSGLTLPIAEYDHALGISVTGGYVYRGEAFPDMQGTYFYADFGSTKLWALRQNAEGRWENTELPSAGFAVSSFGEDEAGEIYLTDFSLGSIYKLNAQ